MKTEDLKAQGLSDEQINFVMGENGKDLKTLQDENAQLKTEKTQLETDKSALEKEKSDKEQIIKELQEGTITKEQYNQKVQELEASIEKTKDDNIKKNILDKFNKEFNVIDTEENKLAINAILKLDELELNKDKTEITGLKEKYEGLQKSNPHFFGNKLNGFEPGDKGDNGGGTETNEAANIAQERNKLNSIPTESKFFK
nr:MAG TPA: minor structural protein [Caudoviricetes sp.]